MSKYNVRDNFKDIFGVYLLESLSFEGDYDMIVTECEEDISKIDYLALYSDLQDYHKTENTCVCFYQYDHVFDGIHGLYNSIIHQDKKRLEKFRERFKNVKYIIGPDYSLYGDFPVPLQIFNVYKSRLCSAWLKANTKAIVVYGFVTESNFDEIFGYAKSKGIKIIIPHSKIDMYKKEDAIYGTR